MFALIRQISLSVVIAVASRVISENESIIITGDVVMVLVVSSSRSCSSHGSGAAGDATEAKPLAQTEPLGNDGCVAGLPLGGEEGKEGLAGDAERWWLAQAPHGCLLDFVHEGDEVLVERDEGVNHEGRKRRADGLFFCCTIQFN